MTPASFVTVVSPFSGVVRALADVPDPVFSSEMVGPGVAVEPVLLATQLVTSPVDGRVVAVYPHGVVVETAADRSVLVHLGIDTVQLHGEGFDVLVAVGDTVTTGQRLLRWSPLDVHAAGFDVVCPVIALAGPQHLEILVEPGQHVDTGDELMRWLI